MQNLQEEYRNGNSYFLCNKCRDLYVFVESDLHEDLRLFLEDRRDFKLNNMHGLLLYSAGSKIMNVNLTFSIGKNDFEFSKLRKNIKGTTIDYDTFYSFFAKSPSCEKFHRTSTYGYKDVDMFFKESIDTMKSLLEVKKEEVSRGRRLKF